MDRVTKTHNGHVKNSKELKAFQEIDKIIQKRQRETKKRHDDTYNPTARISDLTDSSGTEIDGGRSKLSSFFFGHRVQVR